MCKQYKYIDEFNKLKCACPPTSSVQIDVLAYRYASEPLSENSFEPLYFTEPHRVEFTRKDKGKCRLLGVSFYSDLEEVKAKFESFIVSFDGDLEAVYKKFGTHLAYGNIEVDDGVSELSEKDSHINHHPYMETNYLKNFVIFEDLREK